MQSYTPLDLCGARGGRYFTTIGVNSHFITRTSLGVLTVAFNYIGCHCQGREKIACLALDRDTLIVLLGHTTFRISMASRAVT